MKKSGRIPFDEDDVGAEDVEVAVDKDEVDEGRLLLGSGDTESTPPGRLTVAMIAKRRGHGSSSV